jgi:hypothetical protein
LSRSANNPAAATRSISATVQRQRGNPSAACVLGRSFVDKNMWFIG